MYLSASEFKGIVSEDLLTFFVPFGISYVPTPYEAVRLRFKFRFSAEFFDFCISVVSLPCE
jgi:hypothetical protein